MNRTRILFMPCYFGMPSHFIPLVKLYQRLPKDKYDVAFVMPQVSDEEVRGSGSHGFNPQAAYYYSQEFLSRFDIPIMHMKQRFSVINELAAYRRFKPDLVVDDSSLTTAMARQIHWIPRLAIARTGIFGAQAPGSHFPHSLDGMIATFESPTRLGLSLPKSIDGYFNAEAYIVPGTVSLERISAFPEAALPAFYSGPLVLDEAEEAFLRSSALYKFIESNGGRRIAYVTFGIDASRNPHAQVHECLRELLRRGFGIVSNMRIQESEGIAGVRIAERTFHETALPMHYLCSKVDLVVHVAGSATYHYPILHGKPVITVGTRSRDREIIARVLAERSLSVHLPAPADCPQFANVFSDALEQYESLSPPFDCGLPARLAATRLDIERTAAEFDLSAAIEKALGSGHGEAPLAALRTQV